jgi:hypothetical protein
MNIGHVGGKGSVDRGGDRAPRADGQRSDAATRVPSADAAAISDGGRDAAAAFASRVEAAAADEPDRADLVARAMKRLIVGELDREEAHRAVAERLLGTDFTPA